jgi:hypothetical protein
VCAHWDPRYAFLLDRPPGEGDRTTPADVTLGVSATVPGA